MTAGSRDFNDQTKARAPLVFAFVLGLAFVLLLVGFRSLSCRSGDRAEPALGGAAYGCWSRYSSTAGPKVRWASTSIGAIVAWLPLFLFVILFGLSMDYHVFVAQPDPRGTCEGSTTEDAVRRASPRPVW